MRVKGLVGRIPCVITTGREVPRQVSPALTYTGLCEGVGCPAQVTVGWIKKGGGAWALGQVAVESYSGAE